MSLRSRSARPSQKGHPKFPICPMDRRYRSNWLRCGGCCSAEDVTTAGASEFLSGGYGRVTRQSSPATSITAATATPNMANTRSCWSSIDSNFGARRMEPSPLAIRASASGE
jgi:hypothetical protein